MLTYFFKKFGYALLTLFGVITVVFILSKLPPGDPARMKLDQNEDPEQLAQIRKQLGLDQPVLKQYFYYLNDVSPISFHAPAESDDYTALNPKKYAAKSLFTLGETTVVVKKPYLRESFQKEGKTVGSIIAETLPNTALLACSAIIFACIIGLLLGIVSALMRDSWVDRLLLVVTSFGMSIPSFFSAILIAYIFAYVLGEYTGLNMTGNLYEVDDMGKGRYLALQNLLLPALTLGIRPLAVITQLTRNSLLEVLNQDYIRTALAKGLSRSQVIRRHALKNALNPVITATSGWFASMLAGSVFVEFIFGWNGMGKAIVDALNGQDLPVVMGIVLVIGILFIGINILVDLLYGVLDPRVRIG